MTYGADDTYESCIAKTCAETAAGTFNCFPVDRFFAPTKDLLMKYTRATEAVYLTFWLALLEGHPEPTEHPFIVGDLCEALRGRNIATFASRRARKRHPFKLLVNSEYKFTTNTSARFEHWKQQMTDRLVRAAMEHADTLRIPHNHRDLEEACRNDLCELFNLVDRTQVPFAELYDEVFSWHTHSRLAQAKQLLVLRGVYFPVSPSMSMRVLREVSRIHPNIRLRDRLIHQIFKLSDLQKLARIPTAQVPWVGARANPFLQELVLAFRASADQLLIRRAMRLKDSHRRYRLLPSTNLMALYQSEEANSNVADWFSNCWIDETSFLKLWRARRQLNEWPLVNFDIVGPATASLSLDLMFGSDLIHTEH